MVQEVVLQLLLPAVAALLLLLPHTQWERLGRGCLPAQPRALLKVAVLLVVVAPAVVAWPRNPQRGSPEGAYRP